MGKLLSSPSFHIFFVPLLFVLAGALANRLGRRDGDDTPMRNVWAVGTTVLLMTIGTVIADVKNAAQGSVVNFVGWFIVVFVLMLVSVDNDRYRSWSRDNEKKPTKEKDLVWGIWLPASVSYGTFVAYRLSI